jgi:hypothetical protein
MVKYLMIVTVLVVLGFAPLSFAQTADGMTPAAEWTCDDLNGALYGLCVAYCEAMDCHLDDWLATDKACARVLTNYTAITEGVMPPCQESQLNYVDNGSGETGETVEGIGEEEPPS